jgi:FkbM family methyltransferase
MEWLWDRLRGSYIAFLETIAPDGLHRVINGSDVVHLMPEYRAVGEHYEPDVWKSVMNEVRIGDVVVDVGANIGLYAIALAKRVGDSGKVHAFEPDPTNFRALSRHCSMNGVTARVVLYEVAAAEKDGSLSFEGGLGSESHIGGDGQLYRVDGISLDSVFAGGCVDILKIDVEGFEEQVLKGASTLLEDLKRGPRIIYVEVHPFAWHRVGTTGESLPRFLADCGYRTEDLSGNVIARVESYGEIVDRRKYR